LLSKEQQEVYKNGIKGLHRIVPCTKCKKHLERFFNQNSLDSISSSIDMFRFTYDLHTNVKFEETFPSVISFEDALEEWQKVDFSLEIMKNMIKFTSFYIQISQTSPYLGALTTYIQFLTSLNIQPLSFHFEILFENPIFVTKTQQLLDLLRSNGIEL